MHGRYMSLLPQNRDFAELKVLQIPLQYFITYPFVTLPCQDFLIRILYVYYSETHKTI